MPVQGYHAVKRATKTQACTPAWFRPGLPHCTLDRRNGGHHKVLRVLFLPSVLDICPTVVACPETEHLRLFIDHHALATACAQINAQKPGRTIHDCTRAVTIIV